MDVSNIGAGIRDHDDRTKSSPSSSTPVGHTTKMPLATPMNDPRRATLSESPSSWTAETETESAMDTPLAVEPPTPTSAFEKVIYLEGIPEHVGQHRGQKDSSYRSNIRHPPPQQQHALYSPPPDFDDHSLDSVLSSLEDAEAISLDESYYFTPVEEKPTSRISKVKLELQLRSELLEYLVRGQSESYVEQLMREEATVQAWTLACAEQRDHERAQRRLERRRQRQLQQHQQQESPLPSTSDEAPSETIVRRPTAQEAVVPKSLVFGPSPTKSTKQESTEGSSPSNSSMDTVETATSSNTSSQQERQPGPSLWSYWDFEKHHGIPAVLSLMLSCVAHVAIYELVLAVALAAMQPFLHYRLLHDSQDNILEAPDGSVWVENVCYGIVLLAGLAISRISGLLFSFFKKDSEGTDEDNDASEDGNNNQEDNDGGDTSSNETPPILISPSERHLDPRRVDRAWSKWMHYNKTGRFVKGIMDIVGFYLCFVAIMYFLGRFSLAFDQRASILEGMPSNVQRTIGIDNQHQQSGILPSNNLASTGPPFVDTSVTWTASVDAGTHTCPSHVSNVLLPGMKETGGNTESSSSSSSSSDDDDDDEEEDSDDEIEEKRQVGRWDLPQCGDALEEDAFGNDIIEDLGPEDEAYLFQRFSASTYEQFFGHGYRAALFDLPHQLFYNLACSVVAIYTLKRYFGCSFWEDW